MLLSDTFIENMTASFHIFIVVNDNKTLRRARSADTFGFFETAILLLQYWTNM
jgi:hypothetical protein